MFSDYRFVPLSQEFLTWAFNASALAVTPAVQRILEELHSENCDRDGAIRETTKALWRAWPRVPLTMRREALISACLDALTHGPGRDTAIVLKQVKDNLREITAGQLIEVPNRLEGMLRAVDQWARARVLLLVS